MSTLPLVPGALCLICQDQYGADKEKGVPCSLPCGHVLCLACTERIQAETPSCPYCRIAFRRSDIHKLHVIARPFPNGPGDTETAKKLSDKIAEIAAKGIERPQLMKLINDIKSFLASEPRHTHPELRLNYRMISYLGDLKSSNISQYGALKTVADEVEGLRSDKEKLNEEMKLLKKEIRELRQEIEQNEITRKYEHETALAVEGSLREHIERSREAYATLISNYNKLLTEKDPQRQLAPLKTSWEGVALQDPDSSLISPHPLFLSPLPTTSLIRSLPDLREDDEEEEEENRVVEEDDDEDDEDDDDSVTTPDDLTSSHTIDMRDVHDSPPHSHATSALPPRVYEAPKSSLLSRTAPYADRRRPRSSSSPTLPSNPASRDRSPVKGLSGSPPAQSTKSRSSKDTRPKVNPDGQELRFRLANLLDKDTPASLPNPSTGHFPSYFTSREREREPQGQREEPHSSSPPHRASSSVPKAVPPPPPSAPAPPVTHSSASPTPTDPSYLLASHPTQLGQGFISRPSSSAAPSSLPRVATSSASEQAKKMEEERRKQKEQRQAERTKQADAEAQSEREREAQKNRLTPPSSVSASQVAAAVSNPRDYPSMGMNKTPVQAGSLAPTSGSGSYSGNSSSTNLHSSSRRAVASPSIPVPPHPQALPAHIGPYGRPAGPPPMHTSDMASHPPPQYPNWHHAIPTIPSPVQAHSGNTPPRHGSYGSKGIYA